MNVTRKIRNVSPALLCVLFQSFGVTVLADDSDAKAEYTRVIDERVTKILAPLNLSDEGQAERVKQLVVGQYRNLRDLHDGVDRQLADLDSAPSPETEKLAARSLIELKKEIEQVRLHRKFLAELSVELSAEQIDQIKDGMTYGVVPNTYKVYLEMHPDLKSEEKKQILAFLREAREYAMDAGSSDEKHDWFRKYKGKINNYLSAAGY